MAPYPDNFDGAKFDRLYGTSDEPAPPVIRTPIGWECITDNPDPHLTTCLGLVWDDAYRCFFLDVTERKIGRRVDEIAEVSLSRDGLRRLVELGTRMLGDRT
jgi:hypothetical protein